MTRMNFKRTIALTAALAAFGIAGCGSDDEPESTTAGNAGTEAEPSAVTIKTFAYDPSPLEVEAGTTVAFTNEDDILHTVTAGTRQKPGKEFDLQLDGAGTTDEVTFGEPGRVAYFCSVHQGMDGEVVVAP